MITPDRVPRETGGAEVARAEDYNYEHFRAVHLADEVNRFLSGVGIPPGAPAPEFALPRVGGGVPA